VGRTEQGWNLSHHAVTRHQAFKQAHAHVGLDPDGTEPGWSVTGEDGLAYLRSLPSESVDLFITDPPYESLERHRAVGTTTRLKVSKASSNPWFPVVSNSYLGEAITEMYRVLRPARHAYVFCDDETSLVVRTFAEQVGFYWWKSLTWLKVRGSEPKRDGKSAIDIVLDNLHSGTGYHYGGASERIVFLEKRTKPYLPPAFPLPRGKGPGQGRQLKHPNLPDVLPFPRCKNGSYPSEKPVGLAEILIEQSSEPGELVLDPFCGSASVGVAAAKLGRRAALNDMYSAEFARARMLRDLSNDHLAIIADWQQAVEALCQTVEDFLEPLHAGGRVMIDHLIHDTTEEGLGAYTTKGLGLRFTGVPGTALLRARSAMVAGVRLPRGSWRTRVRGRVDLAYGAIRVPLTRDSDADMRWSIGVDDALVVLDESSLGRAFKLILSL